MKTPTSECKAKNPDTCYYHGSNATVNSLKREAVQLVKSGNTSEALKILGKVKKLENPNRVETDSDGITRWFWGGELHREDGPAVIYADGTEEWWQNGKQHRDGEPAVMRADGGKKWYQNGKRHRVDGPAVIYADGREEYWENGIRLDRSR